MTLVLYANVPVACFVVRPYNDIEAIVEYILTIIFVVDILVTFNLAFAKGNGLLEYSRREIFWRYFRYAQPTSNGW